MFGRKRKEYNGWIGRMPHWLFMLVFFLPLMLIVMAAVEWFGPLIVLLAIVILVVFAWIWANE